MAFNPFLSMADPVAPVSTEELNPFMSMTEPDSNAFTGDNPFAASNPFSSFGGEELAPESTKTVDFFNSGPSVETTASNIFAASDTKLVKPTELDLISTTSETIAPSRPPPPPRPLPTETQNLIQSVTGHMEFTSSHLLDRIPPTRTPSPVSIRDIHSPSPTPDPEMDEQQSMPENFDSNYNKPPRPPPARPPPVARPPPPRPGPPPKPPQPQQQQVVSDEINLFDAPVPVALKPTKEDILSLYSAPKKEHKPIDFLSDDFVDMSSTSPNKEPEAEETKPFDTAFESLTPKVTEQQVNFEPENVSGSGGFEIHNAFEANSPFNGSESINDYSAPMAMDCSEAPTEVKTTASTPFDDINEEEIYKPEPGNANPFENVMAETDIMQPTTISSPFETNTEEAVISQSKNIFGSQVNAFDDTSSTFESMQTDYNDKPAQVFPGSDNFEPSQNYSYSKPDIFGSHAPDITTDSGADWGTTASTLANEAAFPESQDAFDAFSAKFDSTNENHKSTAAWGDENTSGGGTAGFEAEAFDPFLSMGAPPPPAATPRLDHQGSKDSADDSFSLYIKPKETDVGPEAAVPALAPPPRPQALPESPRVNPFDQGGEPQTQFFEQPREDRGQSGSDGGETPPTPLFDEDMSMPLEDFPRTKYTGPGWEMHLRQPNKKKITGQRFWKKIFVRLSYQGDNPVVQLLNTANDKEPFQELPLQACYSVSEIGAQQFDQFGKIFTVKLQYVFYKERPGVRPGQVTKAERITNKLSQFAAYAIQGDYQGVKEFGSDLRKLGLPVEHAPQVSQLFKIGSLNYEDVKQFSYSIEEALFRLPAHRDRALTYKMEEVQITAVDELYVEQDAEGGVLKQIARVRLFFLGFLSGMPDVEVGVNDLRRQGKEVVGRHDIIPVVTEEWIRVEDMEFHTCVQAEEFAKTQILKFKPPDACYIELMRFRVRPPKNRELPLQLKAVWCVTGNKVELRADVLVPGFASRKLGQIPCEDVSIRFPIPECWIYLFRIEKHFRYGSVKSAHRRTGKIKGIERFLGAVDTLQESLIEVTSGQAKYEHQHRAIVWRMPRLPKEGQGAYTTHNLVCRMALTSYDQIPAELAPHAYVEFTMPATQVSHMTVRSVSLQDYDNDPPEKYVRYLARHEYIVGIERTSGHDAPVYALVTKVEKEEPPAPVAPTIPEAPSSDSDSD